MKCHIEFTPRSTWKTKWLGNFCNTQQWIHIPAFLGSPQYIEPSVFIISIPMTKSTSRIVRFVCIKCKTVIGIFRYIRIFLVGALISTSHWKLGTSLDVRSGSSEFGVTQTGEPCDCTSNSTIELRP